MGHSLIRVVPSQLECLAVLEVRNSVFVPPYDKLRSGILGDRGFLGNGGGFERRVRNRRFGNSLKTAIDLGW